MSEMLCDKCLEKGIFSVLVPGKELDDLNNYYCEQCDVLYDALNKDSGICYGCDKNIKPNQGSWLAKDGNEYCNHCYDNDFYPRFYGFTRTDMMEGKAGFNMDGEKLHKKDHKLFKKPKMKIIKKIKNED
tara:strand:- start:24512 stop:24901 length:390 start_codon:yes stop_codon:yes gene_type:complete